MLLTSEYLKSVTKHTHKTDVGVKAGCSRLGVEEDTRFFGCPAPGGDYESFGSTPLPLHDSKGTLYTSLIAKKTRRVVHRERMGGLGAQRRLPFVCESGHDSVRWEVLGTVHPRNNGERSTRVTEGLFPSSDGSRRVSQPPCRPVSAATQGAPTPSLWREHGKRRSTQKGRSSLGSCRLRRRGLPFSLGLDSTHIPSLVSESPEKDLQSDLRSHKQ